MEFDGWAPFYILAVMFALPYIAVAVFIGRPPSPAATGGVLGSGWLALVILDALDRWRDLGPFHRSRTSVSEHALHAAPWAALGLLPLLVWLGVHLARRNEPRALAAQGAEALGDGRWRIRFGTVDIHVEREAVFWRRRLLDFRAHVFRVRLPLDGATIRRPAGTTATRWHYEGPRHLSDIWLSGDVPTRLGAVLQRYPAYVEDGVLVIHVRAFLDRFLVTLVITEMAAVVDAARASGRDAVARIQADARSSPLPAMRAGAWRMLADHLPEGLTELAPEGLGDPDPVIRVIAAQAVGDKATLADVLAHSDNAEAVSRAIEASRVGAWPSLADVVAARIGVPPESSWFALVGLLGEIGGREHVARLREVATAAGYTPDLRDAAAVAIARIQGRLGHDAAGRIALSEAEVEGGEVALAVEGGEVSLARADRSRPKALN
ncbi:MAG: hypothetical protein Q8P41_20430 [Pseudomonadota bacterium]|nr:hypothetical protein [Pseudomonadota bacterium]